MQESSKFYQILKIFMYLVLKYSLVLFTMYFGLELVVEKLKKVLKGLQSTEGGAVFRKLRFVLTTNFVHNVRRLYQI